MKLWAQLRNNTASRHTSRKLDSYIKVIVKKLDIYNHEVHAVCLTMVANERYNIETFVTNSTVSASLLSYHL